MVEFALIAPILIMMVIGLVQISQLIQTRNKIAEAGGLLGASITAQSFTASQISNFCTASFRTLYPLDPACAQIVISCVYNNNGSLSIPWQLSQLGPKIPTQTSKVGQIYGWPALPVGFTLAPAQSAICVEVFFQLTPFVTSPYFGPLQNQILYTISVHLPCTGRMVTLLP